MFSLFRKSKARPADDRAIFSFHDGHAQRSIDPLAAWNQLWTDPDGLAVALPEAAKGSPEAQALVEGMVSRAFGLTPFDPATRQGLTKLEIHQLLDRYLGWMADLKKKIDRLPMPWPATGLGSSGKSTTRPAVDSGSTGPESSSAGLP